MALAISVEALSSSARSRAVLHRLFNEYERLVQEAETLAFGARATELQPETATHLDEFLELIAVDKTNLISDGDEEASNVCLALECLIGALRCELEMWIAVKEDRAEDAWEMLISAQQNAAGALRAHPIGTIAEQRTPLYSAIERVVFPPQVYASVGAVAVETRCSICDTPYADCAHIQGRSYWGRFCSLIVTEARLREVSVVLTPADKRCRVTHFSDQGLRRNRMTWRLENAT